MMKIIDIFNGIKKNEVAVIPTPVENVEVETKESKSDLENESAEDADYNRPAYTLVLNNLAGEVLTRVSDLDQENPAFLRCGF